VPRILVSAASSETERDVAMDMWHAANGARRRPAGEVRARRVRDRLETAELVLVARYGERPGGMLVAEQFVDGQPEPSTAHVAMVFVDPALWGSGIGSALVRDLQARDWTRLSAWFRDDNRRARRLFAGTGFADSGHRAHLQDGELIQQWRWSVATAGPAPQPPARRPAG
jgi:GNAT superfamily N-acetyltransferase